jgi:hypothetical protein
MHVDILSDSTQMKPGARRIRSIEAGVCSEKRPNASIGLRNHLLDCGRMVAIPDFVVLADYSGLLVLRPGGLDL